MLKKHLTTIRVRFTMLSGLVCGEEEETLLHFLSNCYANVMMQYCIMGAYSTASGAMQGIKITPIAV